MLRLVRSASALNNCWLAVLSCLWVDNSLSAYLIKCKLNKGCVARLNSQA